MAVKILTDQEPKIDTYLIPPGARTLGYRDFDWSEKVTIPRVEPEVHRTATRVMLGSGEVIFVIDKEVKAEKKGLTQRVDQLMYDTAENFEQLLTQRAEREGVPDVANRTSDFLHSVQAYEFTWTWWEVSW